MVMLSKKSILLAKAETTYGTDPTPTSTDVIAAIDANIKETFEAEQRMVQLKTLSNLPSVSGAKFAEVTFSTEVKASGSLALAPRIAPLLLACGMAQTIQSGVSVTYSPTSSSFGSATLWLYKDGRLHVINGCRGTVKITCEAGKQAMMEWNFKGLWVTPSVTALPTVSYESTVPPTCKGTTFSFNSKTTLVVGKMDLDVANTVVSRPSLSATHAIAGFEITGRKPMITMEPEAQIETSYTFRADALATQRAVSYAIGSTSGNILTINVPKVNLTTIEYADKEGVLIENLTGECTTNAAATGNDEFTLVYT